MKFKPSDFTFGDGDFSVEIAKQANAKLEQWLKDAPKVEGHRVPRSDEKAIKANDNLVDQIPDCPYMYHYKWYMYDEKPNEPMRHIPNEKYWVRGRIVCIEEIK